MTLQKSLKTHSPSTKNLSDYLLHLSLLLITSVESWNKTIHFQAGNGPLLDKIELLPD
jgi:hypothetical protein